jgi:hypothetical protein
MSHWPSNGIIDCPAQIGTRLIQLFTLEPNCYLGHVYPVARARCRVAEHTTLSPQRRVGRPGCRPGNQPKGGLGLAFALFQQQSVTQKMLQ